MQHSAAPPEADRGITVGRRVARAAAPHGRSRERGGVGWDGGVEAGNEVTLFYDSLLAKLVVWGESRELALQRMRRALRELVIVGLPTSQAFHLRMLDDPAFRRGEVDIGYLERESERLLAPPVSEPLLRPLAVTA